MQDISLKRIIAPIAYLLLFGLSIHAQNTDAPLPRLTNKEVLEMVKANISSDVIVAKIKISRCNFDTDPSVLSELKYSGVSNEVLKAMIEAPYGPPKIDRPLEAPVVVHKPPRNATAKVGINEDEQVAARAAIKALRKLYNATDVGVSYVNYAPLVVDAKTEVDESINALSDGPLKSAVIKSLQEYQYAAEIWQRTFRLRAIATKTDLGRYLIKQYSIPIKVSVWTDIPQSAALSYIWKKAGEFFRQAEAEVSSQK